MAILAVYDTTGIQDYIFNSNKLKENVGSSKLVAELFDEVLPAVIKSTDPVSVVDWRPQKGIQARGLEHKALVEIIYQGGGNAYVMFKTEQIFELVTKRFLVEVFNLTMGVGISVAAIETEVGSTFREDIAKLNKRLSEAKGNINHPSTAGNQPITKQSALTGAPATEYDDFGLATLNCTEKIR